MRKTRVKVLFVITKSNWGGAQRYVFDLATNLPPTRYEVVVAVGGHGVLVEKLKVANVRVVTIKKLARDISLTKELSASWHLAKTIGHERPDVLHVNSSKAGALGALFGRLLRVPRVVFTAHGWAFNEDRGWLSRLIIKALHWLTVCLAHHTITVSKTMQNQLAWPLARRKMTTIYNARQPVNFLTKAVARYELAKPHPLLPNSLTHPWTISIGELHPTKQHDVAICAVKTLVAEFPNLRHLIIGDGEERGRLEALIAEFGLTKHVFLRGHLDKAARYLPAADVFVLPSRSEGGCPYALLEAAQAVVPAVASRVGGIPEMVRDGETGTLVDHDNPPALATAITRYLRQPQLATRHGQAAQKQANKFTIAGMVRKTINIY